MNQSPNIVTKQPKACSKEELEGFIAMARAGGEVGESSLATRVRAAECLVFLFEGECLRAIAALKKPLVSYRNSVSEKTGVVLEPAAFPYELGYVFVLPSARGRHLSQIERVVRDLR